ncbi:MAG: hypothetical protein A2Z14_19240 [Chloroflexi bacterium RBG_16_48_8]|nr:MAG: hypothetical protein A2Z14_19240 [Chloroflexi bacterium RBG_16_48_8]
MRKENRMKMIIMPSVVFLMLMLSACNFPGLSSTEDQFATAAAETVAAQLTVGPQRSPVVIDDTATPEPPTEKPSTDTPQPSITPSPTEACTDKAHLVKDVTIPDFTRMDPGENFTKIWRLENAGTCTWTTGYALVFDGGNIMGGPPSTSLSGNVPPGATVDISVDLTAPLTIGTHKGDWKLRNSTGILFGIGSDSNSPFFVQIIVGPTPTPKPQTVYNFVANYCSAAWVSGAGLLSCPGAEGDAEGFVVKKDNPKLENGNTDDEPALFTHPQWVNNGVISGRFPAFNVVEGDHFKTVIGCLYGGAACDVKFQITYHANGGSLTLLDQWTETYDGTIRKIDIDLAANGLAGKSVEFSLVVQANGPSNQDWAFWLLPRIEGPPR